MHKRNSLGEKLNYLLFQKGLTPTDLARKIGIPQSTIHRIVAGKSKKPHDETLHKIADFFNLNAIEFTEHNPLENNATLNIHKIPLFTLDDHLTLNDPLLSPKEELIVSDAISNRSFGLSLSDQSMQPLFNKGCILIFDPQKTPSARSYVLVLLASNKYTIRQLLTDGGDKFLKPLNPDIASLSIKLLEENDKIIATLVEARQNYD